MGKRKKGGQGSNHPLLLEAAQNFRQARFEEALDCVRRLLEAQPKNAQAWNLGGAASLALGRLDDAEFLWQTALERQPDLVEAHYNLGVLNYRRERREAAEQDFRRTLKLQPGHDRALNNLGAVLWETGRADEAEKTLRQALKHGPDNPEALNNLAVILLDSQRQEEAEALLRRALAQQPDYPDALTNLGRALAGRQDFAGAEDRYRRALEIEPDHADTRWCLSLLLLGKGDYAAGWPLYEARYDPRKSQRNVIPPSLDFPQWRGEELQGRSLLLWYEQGYGDEIQFCRFAAELKQRGLCELGLVCKRALVPLFETLAGVDTLYPAETTQTIPAHDFWSFPMSLPLWLGLSADAIPAPLPYLRPKPDRQALWESRLAAQRPRVGLVWQGSRSHRNDANRSLSGLAELRPLWDVAGVCFVNLQLESADSAADAQPLQELGPQVRDFGDSAALVAALDLVICVDTAIAHLCGALGKPCWVLLPCIETDWRWLRDREDSPWYPGVMRLFRQTRAGDWQSVIERVRDELREFAATLPATAPEAVANVEFATGPELAPEELTDVARWQDEALLDPGWARRSELAASMIPAGARVLDLGCGAMHLERHLPYGCSYQPADVVPRDERTLVCDLNHEHPPAEALEQSDLVTMMGVLEYVHEPEKLLRSLAAAGKPLLCSYCPQEKSATLDRRALGWVNDFSVRQFLALAHAAGYVLCREMEVDAVQTLYRFQPAASTARAPVRHLHVLSFYNSSNFGDRLGYLLLNDILPANVSVSWGSLRPLEAPPPQTDLMVLGIGNSLFGELLNPDLFSLVEKWPTVGIFGTQYRSAWPAQNLHALLDRIERWYARSEEDLLLYGRGREQCVHLGDWLIRAFPLARPIVDDRLVIDAALAGDAALDRVIQHIQRHRQVYSTRLHPLLCALTSAERVAYREQREFGGDVVSGKFRSMLLDIFARDHAEDTEWVVDRGAVQDYRARVARGVDALAADLRARLQA